MQSPFGPFWSVKCLNFGQNLPNRTTCHAFLESRHPEVSKNPYYVFSREWSQEKVSAHGLIFQKTNEEFLNLRQSPRLSCANAEIFLLTFTTFIFNPVVYCEVRYSRVKKSSYETELRKMTSHFEVLTRKYLKKFFFRFTNLTA